jgi:hypothetical protein
MLRNTVLNFLNQKELAKIYQDITTQSKWRFKNTFWRYQLFDQLPPYNECDESTWLHNNFELIEKLDEPWHELFKKFLLHAGPNFKLMRCAINGQTIDQLNPIHTDLQTISGNGSTFLLYLNQNWNASNGGQTQFFNDQQQLLHSENVEPGKLIEYDSRILHFGQSPCVSKILRLTIAWQGMYR